MKRLLFTLLAILMLGSGLLLVSKNISAKGDATGKPAPRIIYAIYHADDEERPRYSLAHKFLEMPLNQLGFEVRYYNINGELPPLGDDIYGIVWFFLGYNAKDPAKFLAWTNQAMDKGKRIVVFGHLGIHEDFRNTPQGLREVNRLLERIGVHDTNEWISLTYESKIHYQNPDMIGFERPLNIIPSYMVTKKTGSDVTSHLQVSRPTDVGLQIADLVVTSPRGGYVALDYGAYTDAIRNIRLWIINPFAFLSEALGTKNSPKPDATTLAGRRIFYSHIDGDGWNSTSEIKPDDIPNYEKRDSKRPPTTAEVIQKAVLEAYPEFPVNVGVIVADIDTRCYGYETSEEVARNILALPNVEASSHTYSHPLYWRYFADGDSSKEMVLLNRYPTRPLQAQKSYFSRIFSGSSGKGWTDEAVAKAKKENAAHMTHNHDNKSGEGYEIENVDKTMTSYYDTPRSYACDPYSLDLEVRGSVEYINKLAPKDRPVKLYQWSGDTSPYADAIKATRDLKLRNINGGDTRYDPEYPSYAWVSPLGIRVGNERQIFSSNSNENTYTNLWKGRYYGFRFLRNTIYNTETPIRVKPFNIYYHIISGEKQASLNAVRENLNFARTQELIPIYASHYAAIADGFFTAQIIPLATNRWRIENRGALQTIRFDEASDQKVDFTASEGILGQRYHQGSLYVALDPNHPNPTIALTQHAVFGEYPKEQRGYLIQSKWAVESLQTAGNTLKFKAKGFGNPEFKFYVPRTGKYEVFVNVGEKTIHKGEAHVNEASLLIYAFEAPMGLAPNTTVEINISQSINQAN